jgi:2-polyprenyl-3-methyl-5-hydroxy-6-metoxy-1,4-benzoquinol methylase
MRMQNKNHWYDGLFYDWVIAPNQDTTFELIEQLILPGSSVLDAGCGTGRFALKMKKKYSRIDGVDLSGRNIETARRKLKKHKNKNIYFYHEDIVQFLERTKNTYDYAVITYMIHETDTDSRNKIVKHVASHADEIIIADYMVPRTESLMNHINEFIEFLAGKDHYRNFKSFVNNGGIRGLAKNNNLTFIKEVRNIPATSHIAVLKKK